jgi:hypothetical protein
MMAAVTAETEYEMPPEKSTTPPVTPLSAIAGKIKDAVAAQPGNGPDPILELARAGIVAQELGDEDRFKSLAAEYATTLREMGKGGVPFETVVERLKAQITPATPPTTPAPAAPAAPVKNGGPRHKLIQVLLEDQPEFRDKLVAAANAAQLSPASWAKMVLAEKLGVTLPAPEKRASDPVQKAVLAADKRLLELVLIRDHYKRIAQTEPIILPAATKADAAVQAYVKKLGETVTPEKAAEILKATEEKVAATRK